MPLPPSQPPQELPNALRWRTVKVRGGIKAPMVLAGPPFGCKTHHPRTRTVPCYNSLAGCKLKCPYCTYDSRFTCWVPLINPTASKQQRIVVVGGRRTWRSLEGIEPGKVVQLGRGTGERDTLLFEPLADESLPTIRLNKWYRKIPFDIRPYLFHLWQLRELSREFGLEFHSSIRTEEIERAVRTMEEDPSRQADL